MARLALNVTVSGLVLALVLCLIDGTVAKTPNRPHPTIAIFASPAVDCPSPPSDLTDVKACISSEYIDWLHAAGVRVIPMHWDDDIETKVAAMRQLNGVLFAGGSLDVQPAFYERFKRRVCEVVNVTREWNAAGDPFVLWGTCQGFQMISACVGGGLNVVVDGFVGLAPKMIPLNLTSEANPTSSRFLGSADAAMRDVLTQHASTLNYHHEGVVPSLFETGKPLGDFFSVTSTNMDLNGRQFVSTMEAKNAAVFGVQWHPEWPAFDWSDSRITKTNAAVAASQFAGRFLRSQLMLNNHSYPSPEAVEAIVVEHLPMSYHGYGNWRYWLATRKPTEETNSTSGLMIAAFIIAIVVAVLAGAALSRFLMNRASRRKVGEYDRNTLNEFA